MIRLRADYPSYFAEISSPSGVNYLNTFLGIPYTCIIQEAPIITITNVQLSNISLASFYKIHYK